MATGRDYFGHSAYGLTPPKDQVVVTEVTISTAVTTRPGRVISYNMSISKSGYTPIGIVGSRFSNGSSGGGNTYCNFQELYLVDSSHIYATIIGVGGDAEGCSAFAYVLWVKN